MNPESWKSFRGSCHKEQAKNTRLYILGCKIRCLFCKTLISNVYCGENGIRTRDTILSYTRFPGVPLKPLEHLSIRADANIRIISVIATARTSFLQYLYCFCSSMRRFPSSSKT